MEIAAMNTSLMLDVLTKTYMKSPRLEPWVSGITDLKRPLKRHVNAKLGHEPKVGIEYADHGTIYA